MKSNINLLLLGLSASVALAKSCQDYKIPVTITSENLIYALSPFSDDFDVADFVDNFSSRTPPSDPYFSGAVNQTATYTIAATFCTPGRGENITHKDTVLIATHGLAYDRKYWHPQIDEATYSFVDFAVDQGYSILYYDRLGVSKSSQVSGYSAQLSQQTAILQELTRIVKGGKYTGSIGVPAKVVLVGHSFGSLISIAALGLDSTLADGIILTGYSLNGTYANAVGFVEASQPRIAAKQQPRKWRQLDTGYLTTVDIYANANTFFKKGDYAVTAVQYADSAKQPFAITELLTLGSTVQLPVDFTGAAMIISGKYDFIICTSDCDGTLEVPATEVFSHARGFKAVSYPLAGHGLNLHLNAPGSFKEITDFLAANGL